MSALVLLAIGILSIIVEIFLGSFFLVFIGLGLCITAGIEWLVGFGSFGNVFIMQALSICLFSFAMLILLRKPIKSWLSHAQNYEDSLTHTGVGEIAQGMVYFKGTFWEYECENMQPQEGDKVRIKEVKENKVVIESL
ncbi:NfeD family protein [Helicobacter marmotae]|uniref:NfeD family protein n=1 Tax=Helicobacter marmotae TaxID=152490 RepID=A0A3D8I8E1_9HELI|nr:hypothetical protein [Helicobacter marmotae]RDU61034.1 hypothetical protein CQA63_00570 [Helicobacter marmotae]